jgi:TPR repeat protein
MKMNELIARANQGDTKAMCDLATTYMQNDNFEEGFFWIEKAANDGNSEAQAFLACFYMDEGDFKTAFHWAQQAAKQGDSSMQHNLGVCYRDGMGTSVNPQQQFYWFQQAANNGNVESKHDLGLCYLNGTGTAEDYNKAFSLFEQSASGGFPEAKSSLGACYFNGIGVAVNKEKAMQLWRDAASQGSSSASENLRRFSKKGGCYVATCVYGSYDCPEVWTLRRFRDNTLAKSWFGRRFIEIYYAVSPKVVFLLGNKKWFNRLWKSTLNRFVVKLQRSGVEDSPYTDS